MASEQSNRLKYNSDVLTLMDLTALTLDIRDAAERIMYNSNDPDIVRDAVTAERATEKIREIVSGLHIRIEQLRKLAKENYDQQNSNQDDKSINPPDSSL